MEKAQRRINPFRIIPHFDADRSVGEGVIGISFDRNDATVFYPYEKAAGIGAIVRAYGAFKFYHDHTSLARDASPQYRKECKE